MELARGELERTADRRDRRDTWELGEPFDQGGPAGADLADDRDDGPLRADVIERRQAFGQDLTLDAEDLGLAGAGGHHHEHRAGVSSVGRPEKKKAEVRPLPRSPDTTRAPGPNDRERSCRASKVEGVVHVRARTVSSEALAVNAPALARRRRSRVVARPSDGRSGAHVRISAAVATERSHRGLVQRFAKPPCGVTCIEGSNPSLSASPSIVRP